VEREREPRIRVDETLKLPAAAVRRRWIVLWEEEESVDDIDLDGEEETELDGDYLEDLLEEEELLEEEGLEDED